VLARQRALKCGAGPPSDDLAFAGVRRGRSSLAVAVLLLSSLAAACGGGPAGGVDDSPLGQVRALLRERAGLLAEGDVDGYLAAVAPSAEEAERAFAEGAAAVPLAYANVTFRPRGARSTATSFRDADVQLVYRYEGLPADNQFRMSFEYDVERRGERWLVTRSEMVTAGDEGFSGPPIWATGPVAASRSDHFLALYRPGLTNAERALAAAEEARKGLAERIEVLELDPVNLVLLAGSEEEYAELTGRATDAGELAAARFVFNSLGGPESRQMMFKADVVVGDGEPTLGEGGEILPAAQVFQHELAHLALSRHAGPFTPGWAVEGAAMYLAGERRVAAWRVGLASGAFDGMSLAGMQPGLSDGLQYAYANAAVLHLIDEHGPERFFDLYAGFRPLRPTPEFARDPMGIVLSTHYGLDVAQLDRLTRAYIERAVAGSG
jgi:hypothetical protein